MSPSRVALVLALFAGCSGEPFTPECVGDPPPSVFVTLTDPQGEPIPEPVLTFSVDGDPALPCGAQQEPPVTFVCGEDIAGNFEIQAAGYGFEPATRQAEVRRDGCFVVPVNLDIELEPLPCPDRTSVAVTVTVVDRTGGSVPGAAVTWQAADATDPVACEQREPRVFLCGRDIVGAVEIVASAPDMRTETRAVTVREDFCGMVPEELSVVLRP